MPLRRSGSHYLNSYIDSESWISGIAFGKNLWNHAINAPYNYYRAFNGGSKGFDFYFEYNEQIGKYF